MFIAKREAIEPLQHFARAVDGVDAVPGHAAMRRLPTHGDLDVDPAFVAEADAIDRSQTDDAGFSGEPIIFKNKFDCIMTASFTR